MSMLHELIAKDRSIVLQMEPEELAGIILADLNTRTGRDRDIQPHNLGMGWRGQFGSDIADILMEGWAWLAREALIAPKIGNYISDGVYRITRRGERVKSPSDLEAIVNADRLPRQSLHPIIVERAWASFVRGDYDTAVFASFRALEVAVRTAGRFGEGDYGVSLMRKAFGSNGPLADPTAVASEQEALANLFAGAIGSVKNPSSHRHMTLQQPEAIELIALASYLHRVVDSRMSKP